MLLDRQFLQDNIRGECVLAATWNVQWAAKKNREEIAARLASLNADVLVVTEAVRSVLPSQGFIADAGSDWGYRVTDAERRKVIMWSRYPLSDLSTHDDLDMPRGRLIGATCHLPTGPLRIMGVCIPWKDAHVGTGRKDASAWSEHLHFLSALGTLISERERTLPAVVLGDFNQRIPSRGAPKPVFDSLRETLGDLQVVSADDVPGLTHQAIDHIAISIDLSATEVFGIPRSGSDGRALSDHDLVAARFS